ncbi:MAG: hypothetical protein M5R36_29885 [Deltaproteobacteria bacterium]|nr:hypothetical protein [Deltaproteobacteria bacterium]
MKCYRHLRDDALYDCAVCGRPICGECMRFTDVDDQITCPACDPKSAVSLGEVAAEEYDAYQDQVAQAADRGPSLRDRLSIRLNPFLVLLIFLFAGLYFYFDREIENPCRRRDTGTNGLWKTANRSGSSPTFDANPSLPRGPQTLARYARGSRARLSGRPAARVEE